VFFFLMAAKVDGVQPAQLNLKLRRTLKGHFGKIYAMHWSGNSKQLVSASQVWVSSHAVLLVGVRVVSCVV
jgi:hypothetical protein